MRLLRILVNFCLLFLQYASACAPPGACAGRCGPGRWVIACRGGVECADCPTGTTSPPGSWSIRSCVGCPAGFYLLGGRVVNQAALNAAIARNQYFCRLYRLACNAETHALLGTDRLLLGDKSSTEREQEILDESASSLLEQQNEEQGNNAVVTNYDAAMQQDRRMLVPGSRCAPCPAGSVQPWGGQLSCNRCPPGQYAFDTRSCRACPPGTFSNGGVSQCTPCPAGQFQGAAGQSRCNAAAPGQYTFPKVGNTGQLTCFAGFMQPNWGQTSCAQCPAGRYSGAGAGSCIGCPVGQFKSNSGAGACQCCGRGFFSASPGASKCTRCTSGLSAKPCSAGCGSCPAGTHSGHRRLLREVPEEDLEAEVPTEKTLMLESSGGSAVKNINRHTTVAAVRPGASSLSSLVQDSALQLARSFFSSAEGSAEFGSEDYVLGEAEAEEIRATEAWYTSINATVYRVAMAFDPTELYEQSVEESTPFGEIVQSRGLQNDCARNNPAIKWIWTQCPNARRGICLAPNGGCPRGFTYKLWGCTVQCLEPAPKPAPPPPPGPPPPPPIVLSECILMLVSSSVSNLL